MKKKYTKPELNTKAYAQFESVFTGCNKTRSANCSVPNGYPSDGSSYCAYNDPPKGSQ